MTKDISFMVCCANGAGSSDLLKRTLLKVLSKEGIKPSNLMHCAVSQGKGIAPQYDVVLCAQNFVPNFKEAEKRELWSLD